MEKSGSTNMDHKPVIGAGVMGAPMARNLARKGFSVKAWNRTRAKAEGLVTDGIILANTSADAVDGADVILTMLNDGDSVLDAMQAAASNVKRGAAWTQMSTVGTAAVGVLASFAREHGLLFYDAPVQGSRPVAESGQLVILASGPDNGRSLVQPVYDARLVPARGHSPRSESIERMRPADRLPVAARLRESFEPAVQLDSREEHFRIPGPLDGSFLFLRYLPSSRSEFSSPRAVLYVHGATFPSALSIAHRFDGKSWRDALNEAGFDVWGLDFYGYGHSDRYPEMDKPAEESAPLCTAADAAKQLEVAVRFICAHQNIAKISLISHSWGSMPACLVAGQHPALIERIVMFGPIARREPRRYEQPPMFPGWKSLTIEEQWNRFVEDVPVHEAPVLSRRHFDEWSQEYLDSDPESRTRDPFSVKIPLGPFSEIIKAWHGQLSYDPAKVLCPIAIIRGEWDGCLPDHDARWLFDAFSRAPVKRDIKISRGTHLMHLESMRLALWRESVNFLLADDVAPISE